MKREEISRKVCELGYKLGTGKVSIEEAAEELMKTLRIMPDEKPKKRKKELEKLLKRLKESRQTNKDKISREEFMDNAMKVLCDMSDEEFEQQKEEHQASTFTRFNKDTILELTKKIIEGKFVPWDVEIEILLQIGIRVLLHLKEKPKQQKTAFSLIVNCLAVTLPEVEADEALTQSVKEHKELRQNPELKICGDITIKNILAGDIL